MQLCQNFGAFVAPATGNQRRNLKFQVKRLHNEHEPANNNGSNERTTAPFRLCPKNVALAVNSQR